MMIRVDKRSPVSWRVHFDDKFAGVISTRLGPIRATGTRDAERVAQSAFTHDQTTAVFLTFGTALGDLIDCLSPLEGNPTE